MAALREVGVPDIGEFTDVPIIEVLVAAGDRVEAEDPLVVPESDKATMKVPAPFGGLIQELRVPVGDTVSGGTTLLVLDTAAAGEDAPGDSATAAELTGGLGQLAKGRKVRAVHGEARFTGPHELAVGDETIAFERCVVAAGSAPARVSAFPDDPRIMSSTGTLDVGDVPDRLLVVGGGIIGLEMATVYDALGSEVTVRHGVARRDGPPLRAVRTTVGAR